MGASPTLLAGFAARQSVGRDGDLSKWDGTFRTIGISEEVSCNRLSAISFRTVGICLKAALTRPGVSGGGWQGVLPWSDFVVALALYQGAVSTARPAVTGKERIVFEHKMWENRMFVRKP